VNANEKELLALGGIVSALLLVVSLIGGRQPVNAAAVYVFVAIAELGVFLEN
jgi:hypothetical protein